MRAVGPRPGGTRFRLFPQPPFPGVRAPLETVEVSSPPGSVGPGPADDRMFTVDPAVAKEPYGIRTSPYGRPFVHLPPWRGPRLAPAWPGRDGHFDHLAPEDPGFEAAHLFGCVRFVLDVWEGHFGHRIPWHFEPRYDRLELVLLPHFDNAHAGFGFLEVGAHMETGTALPHSVNFDIIAHEVGHLLISTFVGVPLPETLESEFFGFHEAGADLVSLIATAHFESIVDHFLDDTRGNLYVLNHLNRIAELSDNDEIRLASNKRTMAEFAHGWTSEHDLSEPLTGAVFDVLVDVFHEKLLDERLIGPRLEHLSDLAQIDPSLEPLVQDGFDRAYAADPGGFLEAFLLARDRVAAYLVDLWRRLSPHHLNYTDVRDLLLDIDLEQTGGRYARSIRRNFALRLIGQIDVGPRLAAPDETSHAHSARSVLPDAVRAMPRQSYRERWLLRGHARPHASPRL